MGIRDRPCEGSQELVTDNGIISSLDSFADNLAKVCADAGLRQAMGQNSLIHVSQNFKWESIGRKYMNVLEEKGLGKE